MWLRKAAEADQADAQVTIAQYALRGTPDEAGSRIARTWLERAAAQAASGQYAAAVASERKALSIAKNLDWNLSPLEERLRQYQSNQPWYGNLLAL